MQSKRLLSSPSGSEPYEYLQLWDSDDASNLTSVDSRHNISKLEAYLYYHSIMPASKILAK